MSTQPDRYDRISGECMRYGWPKCCGHTMTIDSPEERGESA